MRRKRTWLVYFAQGGEVRLYTERIARVLCEATQGNELLEIIN